MPSGAEVIGAAGGEAGPLRDRPPVETEGLTVAALERLWPALGRVLPRLLAAVDGHVEHPVAVPHHLAPAAGGPVRLEHAVAVAQVAGLHPEVAARRRSRSSGLLGHGVPRHLPAHEVAVPVALLVRTLAEDREGDVARVQVDSSSTWPVLNVQPSHWSAAGRPVCHMWYDAYSCDRPSKVSSSGDLPAAPDDRRRRVDLDHRQPPAGGGDRVTLAGVRLLPNPQLVPFGLLGGPVDGRGLARGVDGGCSWRAVLRDILHDFSFCRYNNLTTIAAVTACLLYA